MRLPPTSFSIGSLGVTLVFNYRKIARTSVSVHRIYPQPNGVDVI